MDGPRIIGLAIRQADQLALPIHMIPAGGGDLAASSTGEQGEPQTGSAMRTDLPGPLSDFDALGRLRDFCFAQEALEPPLAVHPYAGHRIAPWRQQAEGLDRIVE